MSNEERIKILEQQVCDLEHDVCILQDEVGELEAATTTGAEGLSAALDRIIALEQREAKREDAFQAQEDAYEERMRATMSQDLD